MIIHIHIPRFWIVVEERRRPEFRDRPVIIGTSLLEKTAARSSVLMVNDAAEQSGVQIGMSLAHARQMCPEAVILSPELPLYQGVWNTVMAVLLSFTPLVQSLGPGEAVCDVAGCERLFGTPVSMAREIVERIDEITGLPAIAGVGANLLVAQLAARFSPQRMQRFAAGRDADGGESARTPNGADKGLQDSPKTWTTDEQSRHRHGRNLISFRGRHDVVAIEPGTEATFLASLPVTWLPEVEPDILLSFQVLGLKTIGHLAAISETAMASRFGPLGKRLAHYARGHDERRVQPAAEQPAVWVSRRCDDDDVDGLEPEQAISQLLDRMAAELSDALKGQYLAGKLIMLTVRVPRAESDCSEFSPQRAQRSTGQRRNGLRLITPPPSPPFDIPAGLEPPAVPNVQFFPNQDSRIHSMLPTPRQPGQRTTAKQKKPASRNAKEHETEPEANNQDPVMIVKAMAHMVISQPVNDHRSIVGLASRLLLRIMSTTDSREPSRHTPQNYNERSIPQRGVEKCGTKRGQLRDGEAASLRKLLAEPAAELRLEMRHFAPPEQLTLPGLDGKPIDVRLNRLHRQEDILAARFGTSPFRHITAINLDSVLQERKFQWGIGNRRG